MTWEAVGPILGAIGTVFLGVSAFLSRGIEKTKMRVDYNETLWHTLQTHMDVLTKENVDLRARLTGVEEQVRKCQDDKFELSQLIVRLRHGPTP